MVARYDITDLKLFLRIADCGSVSLGAERCGLAPSSASLRLKGLEEALEIQLFVRRARGVELTRAGQVMADHARRLMAQLEQMHADLHPFAVGIATHLTLFANNNAICSYLPTDLARFFSLFPDVRITLEERMSSEVVAAVSGGRADVGIFVKEIIEPDLEQTPYRIDQLVVLTAKGSDLDRGNVRFADCLRHPFICLQQGAALHTFLVNKASDHGTSLDVRIQVSGYRSIAMLVASGAGIGIVPRSVLEASDRERLAEVDLDDAWAVRDLRLCWRRGARTSNRAINSLISMLAMNSEVAFTEPA